MKNIFTNLVSKFSSPTDKYRMEKKLIADCMTDVVVLSGAISPHANWTRLKSDFDKIYDSVTKTVNYVQKLGTMMRTDQSQISQCIKVWNGKKIGGKFLTVEEKHIFDNLLILLNKTEAVKDIIDNKDKYANSFEVVVAQLSNADYSVLTNIAKVFGVNSHASRIDLNRLHLLIAQNNITYNKLLVKVVETNLKDKSSIRFSTLVNNYILFYGTDMCNLKINSQSSAVVNRTEVYLKMLNLQ